METYQYPAPEVSYAYMDPIREWREVFESTPVLPVELSA